MTVLISSHILSELHQLATRYGIIHKGRLLEEISASELNQKCRQYLRIKVDNPSKGATVLEAELNSTDFEIMPDGIIKLYSHLNDIQRVSLALTKNNLMIFNLIISTLAGFFINIDYATGTIKNQILSGNKRSHIYLAKLIVFSLGSVITAVILPLMTVVFETTFLGHSDIYTSETVMYLLRAFSLYTLIIIAYSSIIMLIASYPFIIYEKTT